jgi:glutamine---fructose-6-phosphate transaminase (isomerizing)
VIEFQFRRRCKDFLPAVCILLGEGLQRAVAAFEFDAQEPVEVKFFRSQPLFHLFAARGVKFHEHFSFLHVDEHAARGDFLGGVHAARELFGALAREAGESVLREVTRHSGSCSAKMSGHETSRTNITPAEKKQMLEMRTAHPYYVYEAIHAQPERIERVLGQRAEIERAADAVAQKERITFVGIGTSLHAARVAESWMREFSGGRFLAHCEQSFELVHHPISFGAGDAVIVITHTGTTTASLEALRMARTAGALTVVITGQMSEPTNGPSSSDGVCGADFHVQTCEQEVAFAYTKSYTTALAVLALLIVRVVEGKKLLAGTPPLAALERVPDLLRGALQLEPAARELAKRVAALARIEIFGSGAAWPTASEAALKIKEACYIAAEGFETEEILHGPFSETDARGSLVGLFTGGATDERGRQILRAAGELKMPRAAITVPSANRNLSAEQILLVPETAQWLAAFVHLIPLQLLTYFLALERGASPDSGRMEQPAHAAASKHYKY